MAAAFATFGNGGKYYKPYSYYEVKNNQGEVILQNKPEDNYEQVITPETAYVMNEMLQTVYYGTGGTGRGYAVTNHRTFGKTGTTSNNYDRWCVGGTAYYIAAVWYGYDYNKTVQASGSPAGRIFQNIMNEAHKNLAPKEFEKYTDNVIMAAYCVNSGHLASDKCSSQAYGWYKASNLPARCTNCYIYGDAIGEEGPTEPNETTTNQNGEGETKPPVTTTPTEPTTQPVIPDIPNIPEIPTIPEIPSELDIPIPGIP